MPIVVDLAVLSSIWRPGCSSVTINTVLSIQCYVKRNYNGGMNIRIQGTVDEETAAAIVAAAELVLAAEKRATVRAEPKRSAWATAGRLAALGIPSARGEAGWSDAERAGRAGRWSSGMLSSFHEW